MYLCSMFWAHLFPECITGPEREGNLLTVTQKGEAGSGPLFPARVTQRSKRPFPQPQVLTSASVSFSEKGRRERALLWVQPSAMPACSQQFLQGLPASRRLSLHHRIKDRWITANEPARTINTGAFPGLKCAQPAGLACHSRGGHLGCWLCVSVPLIALVIGSPRSWEP